MKLIANKQLTGDYGTVRPGQSFDAQSDVARELVRRGVAQVAPAVVYENKATEVAARLPFRDSAVSNQEPQGMATEGDSVFFIPDLSGFRASDNRRRRKDRGPYSLIRNNPTD